MSIETKAEKRKKRKAKRENELRERSLENLKSSRIILIIISSILFILSPIVIGYSLCFIIGGCWGGFSGLFFGLFFFGVMILLINFLLKVNKEIRRRN